MKRIYARGHLGSVYSAEGPVPGIKKLFETADRAIRAAISGSPDRRLIFDRYGDGVVQRYFSHAQVKGLADAGGFKYGFELAPDLAKAIRETQAYFDRVTAETADAVRKVMATKKIDQAKAERFPGLIDPPDFSEDVGVWRAFRAEMAAIRPRTPDIKALIERADEEIARLTATTT